MSVFGASFTELPDDMTTEIDPAQSLHEASGESIQADASSPGQQSEPATIRRRRISLACQNCRSRKTKCDGSQPTCATCRHLGIECVYARVSQQPSARRSTSRVQLLQKVRELERQLHASGEALTPNNPEGIPTPETRAFDEAQISDADQEVQDTIAFDSGVARHTSYHEPTEDVQAAKVFQDQHAPEFGYFGPSSNHAFFRSLSRSFIQVLRDTTLQNDRSQPLTTTMRTNNDHPPTVNHQGSAVRDIPTALPATSDCLPMIDRFFATTAAVLPFVSKTTLITALQQLNSQPSKPGRGSKQALVDITLAHSCFAVGDPSSDLYYQRSIQYLIPETLRGANICLVQALLLLTSYQQQQQKSVSSWTYHALAVKAAFQLGLHCPSSYKELSPSDAGLRLRLWYSLINQDRLLCMCLGRPCLIPEAYVCTPRLADPRLGPRLSSMIQDHQTESLLHHKYLTDLYSIVASMLGDMYQHNIEKEDQPSIWEVLASRLRLIQRFEEWRQCLDHRLRLVHTSDVGTIHIPHSIDIRLRLSLTIHYSRAIIMVNGPILSQLMYIIVDQSRSETDLQSVFEQCIPVIRNDFVILENLHQILCVVSKADAFMNQTNAWWLSNHAGSILAMHLFCIALLYYISPALPPLVGTPASEVRRLLGECLDNMKILQRTSVLFRRAREALCRFTKELDSICLRELTAPSSYDSALPSNFSFDIGQFGARVPGGLLEQPDFDFLLGDGLYC